MSTSDFSKPLTSDTYANFSGEILNNFTDLAKGLDPAYTTPVNVPTNAIRWSSAAACWQLWNGSAWSSLSSNYAINISGNAATATVAGSCSGNAATASTAAACTGNAATASSANALNTSNKYQMAGAGIGVAPSAWGNFNALDVGAYGTFCGNATQTIVGLNVYNNGSNWVAKSTGTSALYAANIDGSHKFYSMASVAANATVTFLNTLNLDPSGNLTAAANVTAYSDERLKADWLMMPSNFLDRVAGISLNGTYTRLDNGARQAGSSAQEWRDILPEVVHENENGILSLAYGNAALVTVIELAKELKRMRAEIELLKAILI